MTQAETVPRNVRAELARSGKGQKHLAERLGITQQSVSARLNGRVDFTIRELEIVADEIGVPLYTLLTPTQPAGARSDAGVAS